MAERRMFAKNIVLSDDFLDMPLGARCLYMTMGMLADDDGFVNSPRSIIRQCGASEDDLKVLMAKSFIIPFESGVVVIKHWRINNYLRNDRYHATAYTEEREMLDIKENGAYTLKKDEEETPLLEGGIPTTVYRDKTSLGKDSIGKTNVVVEDEVESKSLSDRLTDEQWDKLNNQYHNLIGLIDYVDNQVDDESKIRNPFKYITQVAENKKWPRRRA